LCYVGRGRKGTGEGERKGGGAWLSVLRICAKVEILRSFTQLMDPRIQRRVLTAS
jgi:hypothetical protein